MRRSCSHGKKADQETQSPMLKIFKDLMQRENHDSDKSSLLKEKRKTKKKRYFSSHSKSEPKSPDSSYAGADHLKSQYIVQDAAREFQVRAAREQSKRKDNKGGKDKKDNKSVESSESDVSRKSNKSNKSDKSDKSQNTQNTKKCDNPSNCSMSCALPSLKALLSNEYACVGCLLFVFTLTVITAFLMVFKNLPVIPEPNDDKSFLHHLGKPAKRESHNMKNRIDAISKSIKDQKRNVWDNTLPNQFDKYSALDARSLRDGLASLHDSELGPSMELAEVLENSQMKSGDSSERLRDFYTKLLKTDEQIKNLKKDMSSSPDIMNMLNLNPYYRLKRQAHFRNIFSKKKHKDVTVQDNVGKEKKIKHEKGKKNANVIKRTTNADNIHNLNSDKQKRIKNNHVESHKSKKNKNVEIIRQKRFDNGSNVDTEPREIVIEKKKILIQYLPSETSKIVKCSHTPKDLKTHEYQQKHPFYKNTQRLDELLDKVFEKNIKDTAEEPFELISILGKDNDKEETTTAKAVQYVKDESNKVYNQYLKPNMGKAKKLKMDIMKIFQEIPETSTEHNAENIIINTREEKHGAIKDNDAGNNKHYIREEKTENAEELDTGNIDKLYARMERNEATTEVTFDVMLSISTVINSPDSRMYSENLDDRASFFRRSLLQIEEEDEIQYEDVNEVLSDDKDIHDEVERQTDRRKRGEIGSKINTYGDELSSSPKYNYPPGVQNPNWKGPMPLYPDELGMAMNKIDKPDARNKLPEALTETKREKPLKTNFGDTVQIKEEIYELSYLQDYPEPKQPKMAQAYSDYGVLSEKKDAIKNEKTLEKIRESDKIDEKVLNSETDPKTSVLKKRSGVFSKLPPLFTRSKDEKEGLSFSIGNAANQKVAPTKPAGVAADPLMEPHLKKSAGREEDKILSDGTMKDNYKNNYKTGLNEAESMVMQFQDANKYKNANQPTKKGQTCLQKLHSEDFRRSCIICGKTGLKQNHQATECCCKCCNKAKFPDNTTPGSSNDKIYDEDQNYGIEIKNDEKYLEKLIEEMESDGQCCFCCKLYINSLPLIQLLRLVNLKTFENGLSYKLINYTNSKNVDTKYYKLDDDFDDYANESAPLATVKSTVDIYTTTTTDTILIMYETNENNSFYTTTTAESLEQDFGQKPKLKKPVENEIRNSVVHSLSKYVKLNAEKYNTLGDYSIMLPPDTVDYKYLNTPIKKSPSKVKSKKNEKSGKKTQKEGSPVSDSMRRLKSVVFDIDTETYESDVNNEKNEPWNEDSEYLTSENEEQRHSRVKRDAQQFDAGRPQDPIDSKIEKDKVEIIVRNKYGNELDNAEASNNTRLTFENTTVSNVTNNANVVNPNVVAKSNNSGLDSTDFFMLLSNWFGALAGLDSGNNPSGINHSVPRSNVISFLKKLPLPNSTKKPSSNISKDIVYPIYDTDMVDNIGHRSRVLMSIEDEHLNKSKLVTEQPEMLNLGVTDETPTTIVSVIATINVMGITPNVAPNQTLRDMKEDLESNKTLVKRSVPKQSSLIFWNEMYDDEYGVQDTMDKSEEKYNKHGAISSGKKNVIDKSAKWFGDKMKTLRDTIRSKDAKEVAKTRLSRDVNSFGVFTDPTSQYGGPYQKIGKPDGGKLENDVTSDFAALDFAALTSNMKEVCKQAAEAVQKTRNVVVRQDNTESTVTTGLMQQLVKLMSDLVDYEVKQKTCLRLPSDLQDFLEWLTLPTAMAKNQKNVKVISPDEDRDHSQVLDMVTTQAPSSEREDRPDTRSECLGTIHAVRELIQQYTDLSEEDKSKMSGVKEYLESQLDFLNRHLASLSDTDFLRTKEATPFRYKRYFTSQDNGNEKYRPKKRQQKQLLRRNRFLKYGKKHTRTTPNMFDGPSTESVKKYDGSILRVSKFANKMADQNGGLIRNEDNNAKDAKRNLQDVYYKALADAKKSTTLKGSVNNKDANFEGFADN